VIGNATLVVEICRPVFGIKEPSILNLIPRWDSIKVMIPGYMHCVFMGVVKKFLNVVF